ncbi:MAG TPA: GerMN domain-containing protein [Bacillota bacterium]|nr:GerMN domain-containing protein [Bacillota bacterium]
MDGRRGMLLIMLGLLAVSPGMAGCSPVEKTLNVLLGGESKEQSTTENKPGVVTIQPVERPGTSPQSQEGKPATGEQVPQGDSLALPTETIRILLYYTSKDGASLVQESREVVKVPGMARKAMEELLKGPVPASGLSNPIPAGTRLLDINLKPDGLAIVDFSSELKAGHPGGSASEALTVYSIIDTLAQFPTVQRVQILLEGQSVETLAGHLDLSKPLEPDYTMAKQNLPN